MTPAVVILGRPNVGKSTLFNRLVGRPLALVDDRPGVTRDRHEAEVELGGRKVRLIDTAGLEEAPPESLAGRMRASSEAALRAADVVLFLVDARTGITPADRAFAAWLRRTGRPVLVVANKAEGRGGALAALEAYELGLGEPIAISAAHGEGVAALQQAIAAALHDTSPPPSPPTAVERPLRLAIIGRPNVGKSTLLNTLIGEARMITGPEPGLTRDAVAVRWRDAAGREVELVDTAGIRRRARIEDRLEQRAVAASLAAIREAEVVVLVIDAQLGMEEQDLRLARLVEQEGRALVVALNKWDAVVDRAAARAKLAAVLADSLAQLKGLRVVPLSALTGRGVEQLLPAVWQAYALWNRRITTGELNRWLAATVARQPPPLLKGRRIKLRYATMPATRPPTITLFGTRAAALPEAYRRYLINAFREAFNMPGVPIRLQCRSTDNPFATTD